MIVDAKVIYGFIISILGNKSIENGHTGQVWPFLAKELSVRFGGQPWGSSCRRADPFGESGSVSLDMPQNAPT